MTRESIRQLAPIKREVLAEQVAQRLLSLIQSGNLKPGERLPPERELAVTLDVSRPSLREALRALSLLGVVKVRPGGGAFVTALDPESLLAPIHFFISLDSRNIDRLFDARILVESGIARLAATRISDKGIDTLQSCVAVESGQTDDIEAFIASDERFHKAIFEAVDNPFLVKIATSLHVLGQASRQVTGRIPGVVKQSILDHRRIVSAIVARDADRAATAMETHLKNVRKAHEHHSAAKSAASSDSRSRRS